MFDFPGAGMHTVQLSVLCSQVKDVDFPLSFCQHKSQENRGPRVHESTTVFGTSGAHGILTRARRDGKGQSWLMTQDHCGH